MIWVAWRQFRAQAIVAGAALFVVAVVLAATGPHLASLYERSGLAACSTSCATAAGSFIAGTKGSATELIFYGGVFLLYAAPALIGLFWGAPLVAREFEAGTFRLAWNQSISRARWMVAKLCLLGLGAMLTAGLLALMTSWWASPLYQAAQKAGGQNALSIARLAPPLFGANGIAPIGYAAFAFALGVTAGVLFRRTLPAMAVTLVVFAAVQVLWPTMVRPHLIPPARSTLALTAVSFDSEGVQHDHQLILQVASIPGNSWIVSSHAVTAAGQPATTVPPACAALTSSFLPCLARHGIRMQVSYQPASRYWAFQWLETGVFAVAALGLGGICYWRIRRPG